MSLDFENAPMCKGDCCTNLLIHSSEYKKGYCLLCQEVQKSLDENVFICPKCKKQPSIYTARHCGECKEGFNQARLDEHEKG